MYWWLLSGFSAQCAFNLGWWIELNLLQEDWQKEKRDFLQSLSRISALPRTNIVDTSVTSTRPGQIASIPSSPQVSSGPSGMELLPLANKPILEKKASAYAEVVKNLNYARERGISFKVRLFFAFSPKFICASCWGTSNLWVADQDFFYSVLRINSRLEGISAVILMVVKSQAGGKYGLD